MLVLLHSPVVSPLTVTHDRVLRNLDVRQKTAPAPRAANVAVIDWHFGGDGLGWFHGSNAD